MRGGRRAALPPSGWSPPERLPDGVSGAVVLFREENTGRTVRFDCSDLPVSPPVRDWLVRRLAERAGARSGVKRATSFRTGYQVVRDFARVLAHCEPSPGRPADITAGHIKAFKARYEDPQTRRTCVARLRIVLRGCTELPEAARRELFETRLPVKQVSEQVTAYSEDDWQQIMTALRRDVRLCRDRIRNGIHLLERLRAGDLGGDSPNAEPARLLDLFARTGDLPRQSDGGGTPAVQRCGGVTALVRMLTLSQQEATAFALLLSILTAENIGTVAKWPAAHARPDGSGDGAVAVALVEQRKPRRGPDREQRVAAVEDLPVSLRTVLERVQEDEPLFHSPLQIYELLLELTSPARLISGLTGAFVHRRLANPTKSDALWSDEIRVERWARTRGFPPAKLAREDGPPGIDVRRIRQTALEIQRRPVSHATRTLRDHYLRRSRTVRDQSKHVVAEALHEEVGKAREAAKVVVLPSRLLDLAAEELDTAAAEAGLEPTTLKNMLSGELDTAVVSCRDHRDSPHAPPGVACPASFLHSCLNCPNARALPHQLPIQVALHDRLEALRPNMDPALWDMRYATPLARLSDILGHYSAAEREHARGSATDRHHTLITSLLDGRTDVR
ncbi:hypothetical protein JT723_29925 [Streptomyces bryophytorum]|uniref:Uncharacterized protein n=1 Tax=Actinacidiphila bryophytorum TaxID=1436133 RepID=A0A9W4DZ69_9ACTN|nr:hypothetical protein [Actinacidiphila bryophytorum]CAG7603329.1 conserved hypothetical protein [Actinacidiphila bryophytorum]